MKFFGKITLFNKVSFGVKTGEQFWRVECTPDAMIRLKRLFPKIKKGDGHKGTIDLSATLENARELLWFTERYPFEFPVPNHLVRMQADAEAHRVQEKLISDIISGVAPERPPALEPAIPVREYQKVAAQLANATGSLLLGDMVGLGKTLSSLYALAIGGHFPAAIITLTHLPHQWKNEINRFFPSLKVVILNKATPYDVMMDDKFPDVILLSYSKLHGWAGALRPHLRGVIFDEIQELRHNGTDKYNAAQAIVGCATLRMGTSATPIYNYGGEMYNVLSILKEDSLGTRDEFYTNWCGGYAGQKTKVSDPRAFGSYLANSGLMLRRTRKDVGRELPGLQIIPIEVDHDQEAFTEIEKSATAMAMAMFADNIKPFEKLQATGEFNAQMRLATGLSKAPYVAQFVKMLVESQEKVVLFGWHHRVYDVWMRMLAEFNPVLYTGAQTPNQKLAALEAFTKGESKVFILSLRAGAGLDGLQFVSRTCVLGEVDWAHGVHVQCVGRVARDGQDWPVTAYVPLSTAGSDPIIAEVLQLKKGQLEGITDPDAEFVDTPADPDALKRLAADYLRSKGHHVADATKTAELIQYVLF